MTTKINWELKEQEQEMSRIKGGKVLRQLRNTSNFTLKEVGAMLGISFQFIAQVEQGFRSPSNQMLESFAVCYEVYDDTIFQAYGRVPLRVSNLLEENIDLQMAISKLALREDKDYIIKQLVSMVM